MNNVADDLHKAYSDGFADGYKQGMKDAQPEKRWIPSAKSVQNVPNDDLVSRKTVIEALLRDRQQADALMDNYLKNGYMALRADAKAERNRIEKDIAIVEGLPSVQPEPCEYYALCRHGRDENKLRERLGFCEYCNEDADGFVTPLEKNGHAFVRFGMDGWELSLNAKGWHGSAKIRYCPMCGRDLFVKLGRKDEVSRNERDNNMSVPDVYRSQTCVDGRKW